MVKYFMLYCLAAVSPLALQAQVSGPVKGPVIYKHAAVVTAHPVASAVGISVIKQGGNAVDAAVAVQFALAVVYPTAGNLGGGGLMVYRSNKGKVNTLDFREKAPAAASRDMYLDAQGNPITDKSLYGGLASGVPGSVAGMVTAHARYGKLPWATLLQPAVLLAQNGFKLTAMQAAELNGEKAAFVKNNTQPVAFVKANKWQAGDLLKQPDLAATLRLIQAKKRKGFYEGPVAEKIVNTMQRHGGIISLKDLKNYKAIWRAPIVKTFSNYKVISMPPPSSGGIALATMLKQWDSYRPVPPSSFQSTEAVSLLTELERLAYADRAKYIGDPDFYKVPQKGLLADDYILGRIKNLQLNKAGSSAAVSAGSPAGAEHEETTHYSIVDADGNAVALTTTLNGAYGSMLVAEGAGFILNNEMDDFSVKAGVPNMYGLTGGIANSIQPNKRMVSSMTPTIMEKDGKLFMVVGTPGGSTIITSVLQTIINTIFYHMDMQEAIDAPRFHHQWLPDVIYAERNALTAPVRSQLEAKGYKIVNRGHIGRVDGILVSPDGELHPGADFRGDDTADGY